MIIRIWKGTTTVGNAAAYEELLRTTILPGIMERRINGLQRCELYRSAGNFGMVDFLTVLSFESLDAVKEFAGPDYEKAYVPDAARKLLASFDPAARHYEAIAAFEI